MYTAENKQGLVFHAKNANPRGEYFCPRCKGTVSLKRGSKRAHFVHIQSVPNCPLYTSTSLIAQQGRIHTMNKENIEQKSEHQRVDSSAVKSDNAVQKKLTIPEVDNRYEGERRVYISVGISESFCKELDALATKWGIPRSSLAGDFVYMKWKGMLQNKTEVENQKYVTEQYLKRNPPKVIAEPPKPVAIEEKIPIARYGQLLTEEQDKIYQAVYKAIDIVTERRIIEPLKEQISSLSHDLAKLKEDLGA